MSDFRVKMHARIKGPILREEEGCREGIAWGREGREGNGRQKKEAMGGRKGEGKEGREKRTKMRQERIGGEGREPPCMSLNFR